jgi:hypothetical protein
MKDIVGKQGERGEAKKDQDEMHNTSFETYKDYIRVGYKKME